jgi:hypothetical protein
MLLDENQHRKDVLFTFVFANAIRSPARTEHQKIAPRLLRSSKNAKMRNNLHLVPYLHLVRRKLLDQVLKPAHARMELSDDMNNGQGSPMSQLGNRLSNQISCPVSQLRRSLPCLTERA